MQFNYQKKKTYTNNWNNFFEKPKKINPITQSIKKLKFFFSRLIKFKISIRIRRIEAQKDEAYVSYPTENFVKKFRNNLIIGEIHSFLKNSKLKYRKNQLGKYVEEFESVFIQSPIKEHESGFGYNEGVFFYSIIRIINPEIVIESGVMKGFTTYLIDAATNNNCKIYSYDINLDNKVFNSKKAKYINSDISTQIPLIKNKRTVALWDDHTSQLGRLKFSQEHNIEFNFFDDDLSILNLHSDGWPPIPTISMLKDIKHNNIQSDDLHWISRNRKGIAYIKSFQDIDCIEKIRFHKIFPQLFEITGYRNHSQCSLVINKITR
tara:strand:+ start:18893 stop:19855 length:963 start_codon:yes stop_codon:yes gene_type:complete